MHLEAVESDDDAVLRVDIEIIKESTQPNYNSVAKVKVAPAFMSEADREASMVGESMQIRSSEKLIDCIRYSEIPSSTFNTILLLLLDQNRSFSLRGDPGTVAESIPSWIIVPHSGMCGDTV